MSTLHYLRLWSLTQIGSWVTQQHAHALIHCFFLTLAYTYTYHTPTVMHYSYLPTHTLSYSFSFLYTYSNSHHSCSAVVPGNIIYQWLPLPSSLDFQSPAKKLTSSVFVLFLLFPAPSDLVLCVSTWLTHCLCLYVAVLHGQPGVSEDTPVLFFLITIE